MLITPGSADFVLMIVYKIGPGDYTEMFYTFVTYSEQTKTVEIKFKRNQNQGEEPSHL